MGCIVVWILSDKLDCKIPDDSDPKFGADHGFHRLNSLLILLSKQACVIVVLEEFWNADPRNELYICCICVCLELDYFPDVLIIIPSTNGQILRQKLSRETK